MKLRPLPFRISLLAAAIIASGCAGTPQLSSEVASMQNQLRDMRADPRIGPHADVELREAENAVQVISQRGRMRPEVFDQNLYLAGRLVNIARAEGLARHATLEGQELDREREGMLLAARTLEADRARNLAQRERMRADDAQSASARARSDADWATRDAQQARMQSEQDRFDAEREQRAAQLARGDASIARGEADVARSAAEREQRAAELARGDASLARGEADVARSEAERRQRETDLARSDAATARADAEAARQELQQMQTELAGLNARQTERGLVVTVDDVLFEVDRAELRQGARRNLDTLVLALNKRDGFDLAIEGHTDSTGSVAHNQDLSERRARSVRDYLTQQGIHLDRTTSIGLGQHHPVASNDTASGRQQNRRVEIVIQQAEQARVSLVEPR